ncbi:oxidoreductase, partial [candidate division KSB1 bacterium]|nr:oxidoreductase [candidate division KSB1 bacterium]
MYRKIFILSISLLMLSFMFCAKEKGENMNFTGAKGEVKILTIDPGHFHAALVQKTMYDQVSPQVFVYAPHGSDAQDHISRIEGFNYREQNPTSWKTKIYTGEDFLEKMVAEKPGNLMITSGNNQKKTEYIKAAVDAGLNVLADKP